MTGRSDVRLDGCAGEGDAEAGDEKEEWDG